MRRNYNNRRGGGSRWMHLHYAGICKVCGEKLPAGSHAFWDVAAKTVTCDSLDCAEADGLTTNEPLTGPWDKRSDTRVLTGQRIGAPAPVSHSAPTRAYTVRFNSGAEMSVNARGRCEDAPCCGCCT
jgi:hypothetical protein